MRIVAATAALVSVALVGAPRAQLRPQAIVPHGRIVERNLAEFPADALFVVYCTGTHCNGADRAAVRLARLGRKVKKMLGGMAGWKYEGFPVVTE